MDKSYYNDPFDPSSKKKKKKEPESRQVKQMPKDGKGIMGTMQQIKNRKAYLDSL